MLITMVTFCIHFVGSDAELSSHHLTNYVVASEISQKWCPRCPCRPLQNFGCGFWGNENPTRPNQSIQRLAFLLYEPGSYPYPTHPGRMNSGRRQLMLFPTVRSSCGSPTKCAILPNLDIPVPGYTWIFHDIPIAQFWTWLCWLAQADPKTPGPGQSIHTKKRTTHTIKWECIPRKDSFNHHVVKSCKNMSVWRDLKSLWNSRSSQAPSPSPAWVGGLCGLCGLCGLRVRPSTASSYVTNAYKCMMHMPPHTKYFYNLRN